jgi:hypothetical protein
MAIIYDESLVLYERACAAYSIGLEKNHRPTYACHQHCSEILASQEWDQSALSLKIPDGSVSMHQGIGLKLSHELTKIDVRSSKLSLN